MSANGSGGRYAPVTRRGFSGFEISMRSFKLVWAVGVLACLASPAVVLAVDGQGFGVGGAPLETQGPGSLLQLVLSLFLVLAAIVSAAWLLRRFGRFQSSAGGALRIIGGLPVGARERVVLIQVGKTQLLLGVAPGRVQTLHVLEQPIAADENVGARRAPDGFADRLAAALRGRKAP